MHPFTIANQLPVRALLSFRLGQTPRPGERHADRSPVHQVRHHFLGEADLVWLRQLTTERLSDEESRALVFVREVGAIDNAAFRTFNRTDTLQASAHLRRLRDLDILEMKGSGNRTYYVPGRLMALHPRPVATDPHQPTADPHQLSADPHQLGADPHKQAPIPMCQAAIHVCLVTIAPKVTPNPQLSWSHASWRPAPGPGGTRCNS